MAYFTSREVQKYAGFESKQMVDYLYRTGIVKPSGRTKPGRGKARLYTLGDVVLLRAINKLLKSGLPVSRLKRGLESARKTHRHMRSETIVERYLVTDGKDVFFADNPSVLTNLSKDGQMEFAFVIDFSQSKEEVVSAAMADGKLKPSKVG